MDILGWAEVWILLPLIFIARFPDALRNIFVGHLVEYAVACENYKVVVLCNLETSNVRLCLHYILVSPAVGELRFRVAESPGD